MQTTTTHSNVSTSREGIQFCACGQGFSGAQAEERLIHHIDDADPNSLGAALINLFNDPRWAA